MAADVVLGGIAISAISGWLKLLEVFEISHQTIYTHVRVLQLFRFARDGG